MKEVNAPSSQLPWVTMALVLLNVAVYVAHSSAGNSWTASPDQQIRWGGNLAILTLTGDYWRLITNVFMHAGIVHLGMNMYLLILVGPRAERNFGHVRISVMYVAGGVLASCASAWWLGRHPVSVNFWGQAVLKLIVSTGASGAIIAVCGALLTSLIIEEWCGGDAPVQQPGMGKMLVQVIGITLITGLFERDIDQSAHVGGLIAGVMLAVMVGNPRAGGGAALRAVRFASPLLLVGAGFWITLQAASISHLRELRANYEDERQMQEAEVQRAQAERTQRLRAEQEEETRKRLAEQEEETRKRLAELEERQLPQPVGEKAAHGKTIKFGGSGVSFALAEDESKAYIVDHKKNEVDVIDLKSGVVEKRISAPPFSKPRLARRDCRDVACGGSGALDIAVLRDRPLALVTSMQEDAVTYIDLSIGKIVKTVRVGKVPNSIVLSPDQRRAYVHNAAVHTISVLDIERATVVGLLSYGVEKELPAEDRLAMWFDADGEHLFTSVRGSSSVSVFGLSTFELLGSDGRPWDGSLYAVVVAPGLKDDLLALNDRSIFALKLKRDETHTRWDFCETGSHWMKPAVVQRGEGARLIAVGTVDQGNASSVRIANLDTLVSIGKYPVNNVVSKLQFSADGTRLFTLSSAGHFSIIDPLQRLADARLLCSTTSAKL